MENYCGISAISNSDRLSQSVTVGDLFSADQVIVDDWKVIIMLIPLW